eukprot:gnl/TRDRNA2_/TRDRNA2_84838_c0_seq3.p1 gnl/TRDRNA2_/TRDRNA2_84838_c0~~gnl/TRDRNA2_/TRDRNA2_84838_c0_seq3.p1  ORF type:complete len:522 (-),score=58.85 gnl/TRDRNA2_/TRDRNA2_84838_c0_seq3:89-1654(-)
MRVLRHTLLHASIVCAVCAHEVGLSALEAPPKANVFSTDQLWAGDLTSMNIRRLLALSENLVVLCFGYASGAGGAGCKLATVDRGMALSIVEASQDPASSVSPALPWGEAQFFESKEIDRLEVEALGDKHFVACYGRAVSQRAACSVAAVNADSSLSSFSPALELGHGRLISVVTVGWASRRFAACLTTDSKDLSAAVPFGNVVCRYARVDENFELQWDNDLTEPLVVAPLREPVTTRLPQSTTLAAEERALPEGASSASADPGRPSPTAPQQPLSHALEVKSPGLVDQLEHTSQHLTMPSAPPTLRSQDLEPTVVGLEPPVPPHAKEAPSSETKPSKDATLLPEHMAAPALQDPSSSPGSHVTPPPPAPPISPLPPTPPPPLPPLAPAPPDPPLPPGPALPVAPPALPALPQHPPPSSPQDPHLAPAPPLPQVLPDLPLAPAPPLPTSEMNPQSETIRPSDAKAPTATKPPPDANPQLETATSPATDRTSQPRANPSSETMPPESALPEEKPLSEVEIAV